MNTAVSHDRDSDPASNAVQAREGELARCMFLEADEGRTAAIAAEINRGGKLASGMTMLDRLTGLGLVWVCFGGHMCLCE